MNLEYKFKNVSVILPAINETYLLEHTVSIIEKTCKENIFEYIIVLSSKSTKECRDTCHKLSERLGEKVIIHNQILPFLGGAIREGFSLARGSHTIMMASDMETNPKDVSVLIQKAQTSPEAIITASRWINDAGFSGYNPLKLVLNFIFQKLFSTLYKTNLTDMTFGFRLFPTKLIKLIQWEELKHPFLFETMLKPLKLNIPVIEIPSKWSCREEGVSQNTFLQNLVYFKIGFSILLSDKDTLMKLPNTLRSTAHE